MAEVFPRLLQVGLRWLRVAALRHGVRLLVELVLVGVGHHLTLDFVDDDV